MADWVEPAPNDRHPETNRGPSITDDNNKNSDAIADLQEGLGDRDALTGEHDDLVARLAADKAALDADIARRAPRTALHIPSVNGNHVTTPDHGDLDATTELDLRWWGRPASWRPASTMAPLAKRGAAGQRSYRTLLGTDGRPGLWLSTDGTDEVNSWASAAIPNDGQYRGVRVAWRASDGRAQFFTTLDLDPDTDDWTQLGSDVTVGAAAIFAGTEALSVGAHSDGGFAVDSRYLAAQVRTAIDGAVRAEYRADAPMGPRFRDATGKVWTINGSAWSWMVA